MWGLERGVTATVLETDVCASQALKFRAVWVAKACKQGDDIVTTTYYEVESFEVGWRRIGWTSHGPTSALTLRTQARLEEIVRVQLNGNALGARDEASDVSLGSSEASSGVQKIIKPHAPLQPQSLDQLRSLVHSLNNQLSIILTYSDTSLLATPPPPELAEDLEIISKAGVKAAELVRQLHKVFEGTGTKQ